MSKTYVFLMSRKKQDLKGGTLNPGARASNYDLPTSSNLALAEGSPPKPTRNRNLLFSDEPDQRRPSFKSPYERASGVNSRPDLTPDDPIKSFGSLGRYPNYDNKPRPVSEPPFVKSPYRNQTETEYSNFNNPSKKYTRKTAPSYSSGTTTSYGPLSPPISDSTATNRNLRPTTFSSIPKEPKVPNGQQGYQVKAKTWSRLSNTSLASLADKDNPPNMPYKVNNFKQLDSETHRSRLQSKSISDLQARSGSRTEINVPIGTSRNKEFSTSTTELQSRFRNSEKRNSRGENDNWFQPQPTAPGQFQSPTTPGQFQSMTNLKLKSPDQESILENYERIVSEGINSSCNTSYGDLRVVSTVTNPTLKKGNDIFLEDALERAQRKIQTDKTRPQTIYTESVAREEQLKEAGEVRGRPVAVSRLTSDPWFDDSMPRLIPPSNRLADNTDAAQNTRLPHTLPRNQSSMTDREIVAEIQNIDRQFAQNRDLQNIKPQNSYSAANRMHSSSVFLPRQNDAIARVTPTNWRADQRVNNYDTGNMTTQSLPRTIGDIVGEDLYDYIPNDLANNDVMTNDSFGQSNSLRTTTTSTRTQRTVAQKSLTLNSTQRIDERDISRRYPQAIQTSRPQPHPSSLSNPGQWQNRNMARQQTVKQMDHYRQTTGEHRSDSVPSNRHFEHVSWGSRESGSSNVANSRFSAPRR